MNNSTSKGLVTGVGPGSTTISVSYTDNTYRFTINLGCILTVVAHASSSKCNVQIPGWLKVILGSYTNDSFPCGSGTVCRRLIRYQVLDNTPNKLPIPVPFMKIQEYNSSPKNDSCKTGSPISGSWLTDATGSMPADNPDGLATCPANPPGCPCTEEWYQSFTVAGYSVQIIDHLGGTGSKNDVFVTCGVCPAVSAVN